MTRPSTAEQAFQDTGELGALPEPVPHGQGWLVQTKCRWCRVDVALESPGAFTDDETGEEIALEQPSGLALRVARSLIACERCAAEHDKREESAEAHRIFRVRLQRSGLPNDLRELRWEDMDRTGHRREPILAARGWTQSDHGRLFLHGPVGTGKTRLAATAAWTRLAEKGDVLWISVPVLFQWAFYPASSPERQQAQRALASTVPVILDDLGKEKPGDWARQILFGAIDIRLQAGSPMFITSNFNADQIAAKLGDPVASRLQEFKQFCMPGEDRRAPADEEIPI